MAEDTKDRTAKIMDPWEQCNDGTRVHCGSVGVDSGSIVLGDNVVKDQCEVLTVAGDGEYPVFAQMVNGRRCLVVDLESENYGPELYSCVPQRCPKCGDLPLCGELSALPEPGEVFVITCDQCKHRYTLDRRQQTDFVKCAKTLADQIKRENKGDADLRSE